MEHDKRCQALSAGTDEIDPALNALDEKLRTWLRVLGQWHALGVMPEPPPPEPKPRKSAASSATRLTTCSPPARGSVSAPPTRPEEATAANAPAPPDAAAEEDEALLATLDAETASAIRVKRRLSGKKHSVRELLAEVQAARSAKPKETRRGSWLR